VIEQFPGDAEFVIALGHKGHLVREFLHLAYPSRQFLFAEVQPFEGPASGLGLSLLACRQHLQQPFVFVSCDTLVREPILPPAENWMGFAERTELGPYRTLRVESGLVRDICEKGEGRAGTHEAYIGLAGICDYARFWAAMELGGDQAIQSGEAHGLRNLLSGRIVAHRFTWYDTGSIEALARTREAYREPNAPNILEKPNEAIWFVAGQVIKFSDDEKFIANRIARAEELRGFVPTVTAVQPHMYRYARAEGTILSEAVTVPLFHRLLDVGKTFWTARVLNARERQLFRDGCLRFYREKTLERVELFFETFTLRDGEEAINGVPMPKLGSLLDAVDWAWLADGVPGRFHGDFHFENILWSERDQRFTFLDWRQDFGGSLTTGDVYYDLAKLLHGLIISHELIAQDQFRVDWGNSEILYDFHRKQILVECERHFHGWLESEGYDSRKVRTLTALVYLNIAALHHYPYSLLLLALGKAMLHQELES
jgi:hypothetical protein